MIVDYCCLNLTHISAHISSRNTYIYFWYKLPDNLPWVKLISGVFVIEKLKSNHSKDVDHNDKDKSEISEGSQCVHDDRQKETHSWPGLG